LGSAVPQGKPNAGQAIENIKDAIREYLSVVTSSFAARTFAKSK